jgi:hypothetical protein
MRFLDWLNKAEAQVRGEHDALAADREKCGMAGVRHP